MVTLLIAQCGRDIVFVKGNLLLYSQDLSSVSVDLTVICCGGSTVEFNKALDKTPSQKAGIQHPFTLSRIQAEELIYNLRFSV